MKNILLRSRLLVLLVGLLAAPALWSCNSETAANKIVREHEEQLRRIDGDTIRSYLGRKGLLLNATSTTSGIYLVPLKEGTGTMVTTGKNVRVKYVGRFLSNGAHPASTGYPESFGNPTYPQGSIFDNSSDNRTACGCAVFTVGNGSITAGFNEALLLMRQGDRKLILIPSRLMYGPTGSAGIPPDSALMFDAEVLEVL